jgi:predicted naringenin-chalcone synthase
MIFEMTLVLVMLPTECSCQRIVWLGMGCFAAMLGGAAASLL